MRYAVKTGYLGRRILWVVSRVGIEYPYKAIDIVEWYMWKGKKARRFNTLSHDALEAVEEFDKLMRNKGTRNYVVYRGDE